MNICDLAYCFCVDLSDLGLSLQNLSHHKCQQETQDHGAYKDFHGGIDPANYDILIADVDNEKLRGDVAKIMVYRTVWEGLRKYSTGWSKLVTARKLRTIFSAVVAYNSLGHWVFFIVGMGHHWRICQLRYVLLPGKLKGCLLTNLDERPFWHQENLGQSKSVDITTQSIGHQTTKPPQFYGPQFPWYRLLQRI